MMPPQALGLFKIYCLIMTLMYGALAALAVVVPLSGIEARTEDLITFLILGIICFPFALAFGYGLFLPRRDWAWTLGLVLILVGLTSCCFWPIGVPLLLGWVKPETKSWFGKDDDSGPRGTDGW